MIQRIQTVYLFLAAVLAVVAMFVSPIMFTTPAEAAVQQSYLFGFASLGEMSTWALPVVLILIAALSVVDIFLFRKRILQARLCVFTVFFCLGYYALLAMYTWFAVQRMGVEWYIEWSACLPLISLVLTMMAVRRILADEALVRAADRLR